MEGKGVFVSDNSLPYLKSILDNERIQYEIKDGRVIAPTVSGVQMHKRICVARALAMSEESGVLTVAIPRSGVSIQALRKIGGGRLTPFFRINM